MIPVKHTMTEFDNLEGEETQFSISDPRWVMRSMADLYSNRELAVVREYSTNAYDSNREAAAGAARPAPIHVTLPTNTNPYFIVKDYGVGMTESELKEIYTKFGESTKRDSNDYNGMLGFGCKSAVAYTNTFTITSIKNGFKTIAIVTRKEDYAIVLKVVVPSVATTECNGVEIKVPVNNPDSFSRIARDFYRFWKPGTVLINGEEPEWAVGDKIADNLFMNPDGDTSYVVMGNVPYRIANPAALFKGGMRAINFVAYVDNGAVEFTPSREDLKYSEHTKASLHKVIDDFIATALETAKKEINGASAHWEAFNGWMKWREILGYKHVEDLSFKGDKFEETITFTSAMEYRSNSDRYNTNHTARYSLMNQGHTIFVTNFPSTLSSHHKARAKAWRTLKQIKAHTFIFTSQEKLESPWLDPSRVVSWEQVKIDVPPVQRPKGQGGGVSWGRKAGTFDLITQAGRKNEQDIPHGDLYYIMLQKEKDVNVPGLLKSFNKDWTVVVVPANRRDKFLRNYRALPVLDELSKEVVLNGDDLISDLGQKYLSLDRSEINLLINLKPDLIDDPEVHEWINIAKQDRTAILSKYQEHFNLACALGKRYEYKAPASFSRQGNGKKPVSNKYPLLEATGGYFRGYNNSIYDKIIKEVYYYMNARYKESRKDGTNV